MAFRMLVFSSVMSNHGSPFYGKYYKEKQIRALKEFSALFLSLFSHFVTLSVEWLNLILICCHLANLTFAFYFWICQHSTAQHSTL